jgi:hypothetical protein
MSAKHVALLTSWVVAGSGYALSAQAPFAPPAPEDPCAQAAGRLVAAPDPYAQAAFQAACQEEAAGLPMASPDSDAWAADQGEGSDQPAVPVDPGDQAADQDAIQVSADGPIDLNFFVTNLSSYGQWVLGGAYGWVWHPYGVDGWRPYTLGHWVLTNFGWTWVSNERFGWVTYHYGRWLLDREHGWIWVPGYVWGPAWVVWRVGGGFIGWAPLPPAFRFGIEVDPDPLVAPGTFCFVEERSFLAPSAAAVIAPPSRNEAIISNTVQVNQSTAGNSPSPAAPSPGPATTSPSPAATRSVLVRHLEQLTGRKIRVLQVRAGASGEAGSEQ